MPTPGCNTGYINIYPGYHLTNPDAVASTSPAAGAVARTLKLLRATEDGHYVEPRRAAGVTAYVWKDAGGSTRVRVAGHDAVVQSGSFSISHQAHGQRFSACGRFVPGGALEVEINRLTEVVVQRGGGYVNQLTQFVGSYVG